MKPPKLVHWSWGFHRYHHNNWERYKLSREAWEDLWIKQDGKCAICKIVFAHPEQKDLNKQGVKCYVDHKHFIEEIAHTSTPKEVRGLLCYNCNSFLGVIQESQLFLKNADAYLTEHGVSTFDYAVPAHAVIAAKRFYEIDYIDDYGNKRIQQVEY